MLIQGERRKGNSGWIRREPSGEILRMEEEEKFAFPSSVSPSVIDKEAQDSSLVDRKLGLGRNLPISTISRLNDVVNKAAVVNQTL